MQLDHAKYLKDYREPDYFLDTVELRFELNEDETHVFSTLVVYRNPKINEQKNCILFGEHLILNQIKLNGRPLSTQDYEKTETELILKNPPERFNLEIDTTIYPQKNTTLNGLYKSRGNFCTQCEAEGFRRITYFPDRPDVMAKFTVTLIGDKKRYPVLLSNGNLDAQGDLDGQRHFARWVDPFKKPSYLFALVAADLDVLIDHWQTRSGRRVELRVYVEKGFLDQSHHAMQCIKKAMKWDEETFDREYDLDIYMIVAVDDFNMGAMENKGLNLFNSKYILAKKETATDDDFLAIESVIGHEYFHNWTGNRITCRDWFQLSLKEGLTIFRDQEFISDLHSRPVKRIEEIRILRSEQFPQDAGPMAHSVRPDSYIEMNNFYTVTVYNKGAEVIRMIQTLLGKSGFKKGMDLYFERHDGQAVTTEDFVKAMEDGGGIDLKQFRNWYEQAGTPHITVTTHYDSPKQTYTLVLKQECPATPGQIEKKPFHIPIAIGLLDQQGNDLPLMLEGSENQEKIFTKVLELKDTQQDFVLTQVAQKPVLSILRDFSAPVKLIFHRSDEELIFLLTHDSDLFNRWDAGQNYSLRCLLKLVADVKSKQPLILPEQFVEVFRTLLRDPNLEKTYLSLLLTLPDENYIAEQSAVIDPLAIYEARQFVRQELAVKLKDDFLSQYKSHHRDQPADRCFKNLCLSYLMHLPDLEIQELCEHQFKQADNMTDSISALQNLAHSSATCRDQTLAAFYERWKNEHLVVNKWFAVQARSRRKDTLEQAKKLLEHPAFHWDNPNNVRAVIGVFSHDNTLNFHDRSGSGYEFLSDAILKLDALNPQVAARLLEPLIHFRRYAPVFQAAMRQQLERMAWVSTSKDVGEILKKSLH